VGRKKIAMYGYNESRINISIVFNRENAGRERERYTTTSPTVSLLLWRVYDEGRTFTYHRFPP